MRSQIPLNVSVTAVLDGSGDGTASAGPNVPGVTWMPDSVYIAASGGIPAGAAPATCTILDGLGNQVDATYQVTGAASSMISGRYIYPGQVITAVFANCNPGATATLVISGMKEVP